MRGEGEQRREERNTSVFWKAHSEGNPGDLVFEHIGFVEEQYNVHSSNPGGVTKFIEKLQGLMQRVGTVISFGIISDH